MLFNVMNKWEKMVFYEFNISFSLFFHKWKIILNNIYIYIYIVHIYVYIYITSFYIQAVFYIFPEIL